MEENNTHPIVEVVAFGYNRGAELESFVRRLHKYLGAHLLTGWQLTIADNGSADESWALANSIAGELPLTSAVRIRQRLGRKELRFQWSQSQAIVVAFIEIKPETDFEKALAPLTRDATRRVEPGKSTQEESGADLGLTRRSALIALGSVGLSAFLAACARAAETEPPPPRRVLEQPQARRPRPLVRRPRPQERLQESTAYCCPK